MGSSPSHSLISFSLGHYPIAVAYGNEEEQMTETEHPNRLGWFTSLVAQRGSILPIILPRVLLFAGLGGLVSVAHSLEWVTPLDRLGELTTNVVCNLVLGLLLVFRTNTAYDRYWEGRKAWGTLVINIRNLAREMQLVIAAPSDRDKAEKQAALRLLSAFAIATKLHLRQQSANQAANQELETLLSPELRSQLEQEHNPPLKILLLIGQYCEQEYQQQHLDSNHRFVISTLLSNLVEGLTGCERILRTPIPPAYIIYLRRLILIYCLFIPFGLVDTMREWTGLVVAIISFVLLGVEEIGNEIEDPFGTDPNDLPIDAICNTVLQDVETAIALTPGHLSPGT